MENFELSRIILILVLFINACSLLDPFVDRRREAGAKTEEELYVGESKPDRPAVCYNLLTTEYAEVKRLADEECQRQGTGSHAEPINQTLFTCRLLVPNHVYFQCMGKAPANFKETCK